ncbi:MAG: helix-turn-helix domain-containing protein [Actinomycetales bacterium]|nr:helix-turn-helix domain-containing protein [Actinomycetales bacterium]
MRRRPPAEREHRVISHLGSLLDQRGMTLVQLAEATGVTVANLSVLKNDRARAVRYSTLTAVCDALGCQPGDLLSVAPAGATPAQRSIDAHSAAASAMAAIASASVTGEKSS